MTFIFNKNLTFIKKIITMEFELDTTQKARTLMMKVLDAHSLEDVNKVPKGFKNNIFWNVAHVIVTQQLLVYKLSGLPLMVSDEMVNLYKKDTKTERDATQAELDEIKGLLVSTIEKTKADYDNKVFKNYNAYTTSTSNTTLTCAEDAIAFNNFHEGMHLGYILALRKNI